MTSKNMSLSEIESGISRTLNENHTTRPQCQQTGHSHIFFFIAQTNDLIMTQFMPLVDLVTLADFHRALTIFAI